MSWIALGLLASGLYFWGLNHNSAAPAYAYGHQGVPPTFSTLEQLQAHPWSTLVQMGLFVAGMFGNAVGRGFPVYDNLMLVHRAGLVVMLLAAAVLYLAWRRDVLRGNALPWTCLLIFCFLTAAFVCVGRVWRGEYQPLTMRYTTFGTFVVVSLVLLFGSVVLGGRRPFTQEAKAIPMIGTINQAVYVSLGALIGIYLSVQWVGWRYGTHLMEEWEMARWRSRASLHFLGSLYAPELVYRYLGGQKEIFENGVPNPGKLGDVQSPSGPGFAAFETRTRCRNARLKQKGVGEDGKARRRRLACRRLRGLPRQSSARSYSLLHAECRRRMGGEDYRHALYFCSISSQQRAMRL